MSSLDPVSDFLAREQEALADLGEEINLDDAKKGTDNFEESPNLAQSHNGFVILNGNSSNNFDSNQPTSFDAFEPEFGQAENQENVTSNGFCSDKESTSEPTCPSEATQKWREEFLERIKKKDAEEEVKKAELEENGKKELENWYKMYKEQLKTRSKDIRERREDTNSNKYNNGTKPTVKDAAVWENICDMCDFQAKPKVAPDMSRMRGILLSLKPSS